MNRCEPFEERLSAIVDGEIDTIDLAATLDHLVECDDCRGFYRQSRALDRLVLSRTTDAAPVSEAVWRRIAAASAPPRQTHVVRGAGWRAWGPAVAAAIVLSIGLWWLLDHTPVASTALPATGDSIEIVVGEDQGQMSDARFVQLTTELLRADGRYHRKMREVMDLVADRSVAPEGSAEPGYDGAAREGDGRPRSDRAGERGGDGNPDRRPPA